MKNITEIKNDYDFVTKLCMAANFISMGGARMVEENIDQGDSKDDAIDAMQECMLAYNYLYNVFTDSEIQAMANELNNIEPNDVKEMVEFYEKK